MSTSGYCAPPRATTNAGAAVRSVAREPFALRALDRLAEATVLGALLVELLLVLANVIARIFFRQSFLWSDEVARLALSILAFIGGAVAYRRRDHAQVRLILNLLPRPAERVCLALADVLVFFVGGLIGIASIEFIAASWAERTPILQAPAALIALPLPVGTALMSIYAATRVWREHGRLALLVAAFFLAATALAATTYGSWLPVLGGDSSIIAALVLFFATIFAGVPVGFVLLLAAASYLWTSGAAPLLVLPQTMVAGAGNYILLAIPFFILAGLVMERGGISVRLIRFVHALVGHLRGGLLQVAVVSMNVISGLSGSKPADVAAVGTIMRDEISARHGAPEGAAVLAVSAIMGETVPPSIAMLIVGSITNVSVAGMFIGGLMPAAIIALCLMALIAIRARRDGALSAPRTPARMIAYAGFNAILPLLMPGMLFAGILFGLATPTEVAALAVVYGVILAMFVYREMTVADFLSAVQSTATLTGVLLFIFTAASAFSWVLTIAYLPQRLVDLLAAGHANATIFMVGSIALLIFVGVLLEGLPSLNVLAPLLLPIAVKLGFSGLHFALVLIIAMGVGGFMPLAGVGFYVCCAVMRCEIEPASRAMLPYLVVVLAGLLIVAFVPWFALALPNHFGFHG
jgi:tripartite ATP-independent transporter DctM subunit